MIALFAAILLAYILGSLSGSLLLGRFRGVDIRTQGSGNAGGTNALRTQGVLFALGVMIIDVGKGYVAADLVSRIVPAGFLPPGWSAVLCALAAMIGHVYPVFHGFRGGKGAAAFVGAAAAMLPSSIGPVIGLWAMVVLLTGYVGLATMAASLWFVIVCLWLAPTETSTPLLTFAAVGATLIVFTHRSNIQRLRSGTENRFERVRVANWFR